MDQISYKLTDVSCRKEETSILEDILAGTTAKGSGGLLK